MKKVHFMNWTDKLHDRYGQIHFDWIKWVKFTSLVSFLIKYNSILYLNYLYFVKYQFKLII